MSVSYSYLEERITDGLKSAADAATGMGLGNRRETDAALHSRFIVGIRTAETAARGIAHARGEASQGIAWVRLATRLGVMLDASTRAAADSAFRTLNAQVTGRGVAWVKMGQMLAMLAEDCQRCSQQRGDKPLMIGGMEYIN